MPKKSRVRAHGTQAGQQSKTETYKSIASYKTLNIKDDILNQNLKDLYDNNIWQLKFKFESLSAHYDQIGISSIISWNEGIQYLDFDRLPKIRKVSLNALSKGEYRSIATDRPNSINTEKTYSNRIKFFAKTFEPLNKFINDDDFSWILKYNREVFFLVLNYHNINGHSLAAVNNDLKCLIRAIKLILVNPDEEEIRWKYSALQIAIGDIERFKDDFNSIISVNELRSFVPYEDLLDLVDKLETNYKQSIGKVPLSEEVHLNQVLLAVAIMVLDYPSRLDKFDMNIITDEAQVQEGKCYILLTNPITFIFNNDKKLHKPLKYKLMSHGVLSGLNKRLNNMIMESLVKYPRFTLFIKKDSYDNNQLIPVKEKTITEWIRNLIPNRTLNIGTFRSSFVSYYYPKINNLEKKLMVIRMRTSLDELNRAYLKFYNNPDTLLTVKPEPTAELINRVSSGQFDNPIIVNNQIKIKEEPIEVDEGYMPIQQQQPIINKISINERKRIYAKNWYNKNREQHKANVKARDKDQLTIRKRYIRELNNKVLDYSKIKPETITKYYIQYDKNKDFYY
jgi:hypothetical protein